MHTTIALTLACTSFGTLIVAGIANLLFPTYDTYRLNTGIAGFLTLFSVLCATVAAADAILPALPV